jgi:hypothetical protein
LIKKGLEIAGEAFRKTLVHGERVLRGARVHTIGVGGFNDGKGNRVVVREEVEVEVVEDAVGSGSVPFGFMGTFLERGEERWEFKDRTIPSRGERQGGLGHGGRAGARGHVEWSAVVKELEDSRVRSSRWSRGGWGLVLELLLHEDKDGGDVVESVSEGLGVRRGVGHGGTGCVAT